MAATWRSSLIRERLVVDKKSPPVRRAKSNPWRRKWRRQVHYLKKFGAVQYLFASICEIYFFVLHSLKFLQKTGDSPTFLGPKRFRINVAGRLFETTEDTLRSVPGSYFSAQLEHFREGQGGGGSVPELYLDEDPEAFSFALEYFRFRRRGGHFDLRTVPLPVLPRLRSLAQYLLLDELEEECSKALSAHLEPEPLVKLKADPLKEALLDLMM